MILSSFQKITLFLGFLTFESYTNLISNSHFQTTYSHNIPHFRLFITLVKSYGCMHRIALFVILSIMHIIFNPCTDTLLHDVKNFWLKEQTGKSPKSTTRASKRHVNKAYSYLCLPSLYKMVLSDTQIRNIEAKFAYFKSVSRIFSSIDIFHVIFSIIYDYRVDESKIYYTITMDGRL